MQSKLVKTLKKRGFSDNQVEIFELVSKSSSKKNTLKSMDKGLLEIYEKYGVTSKDLVETNPNAISLLSELGID